MTILYIDPVFGVSGDMLISAFIDAGCPFETLQSLLSRLPLSLPAIAPRPRAKGIVSGTYLAIGDSDLHLSVDRMRGAITGLSCEERVKRDALAVLDLLVEAESKIHDVSADKVHFHELAHVDTLIDILCVAQAFAYFDIDKAFCGPVPQGRGFVRCSHGVLPNPPPVTVELLRGFPIVFFDRELELTTPTGAAMLRHYVSPGVPAPAFSVRSTGCGFGTYETDVPNAVRIFIGDEGAPSTDSEVWVVETDMDDCEMEFMGAVAERLRREGALDVLYYPVYMKKGRVGIRLSVTVGAELLDRLAERIFSETTTFGLRLRREQRNVLRREESVRETSLGPVRVKKGYDGAGKLLKLHIEYEDVKEIADKAGMPYRAALEILKKEL